MRLAVISSVLAFLLLGHYPYEMTESVHADTQLSQRPREVLVAHLGSDSVAGRKDFIFRLRDSGTSSTITAYAPGGTVLFSILPDPTQPIDEMIGAIDLDGDGSAEIIGIHKGDGVNDPPVLYVYDGYGNQKTRFAFLNGMTLDSGGIKVYHLYPNSNQYHIVAAPNTFPNYTGLANNTFVYFFDSNGTIMATPGVPQGLPGEFLTFPGVIFGDVNNSNGFEIFVIAKSRLLAFDQNGKKLYYKQFVDSGGSFTSYNTALDVPSGATTSLSGRRYGMYKLMDVNGDGDLELVVAADRNNLNNGIPGAVYEAYNVTASPQSDGWIGNIRMWQTWIMNSSTDVSITNNNPQGYTVGVSFDGITDVNGDGVPDIVVTENVSGTPVVRVINARTGAVTGAVINGFCLDVHFFDTTQPLPDLVIYDTTTPHPTIPGVGTHMIWRFNQGTYTPVRLTESPTNTLAAGAAIMLKEKFAVSSVEYIGINTGQGHYSVEPGRSGGVWSYTAYSSLSCPSALYSWTTTGGVIQRSLDISSRPGEVLDILKFDNAQDRLWILNLGTPCTTTNIVRTARQSGSSLIEYPQTCTPQLSSIYQSYPATPNPATGDISITVGSGCSWTATRNAGWITLPFGNSGTGTGTLTYSVAQNASTSIRNGTITVSGEDGSQTFTVYQGVEFADVPTAHLFYAFIGKLSARGVTVGCGVNSQGQLIFCPEIPVPHEQMATFVMRAKAETDPPTPASQRFADVFPSNPFYAFIDRIAALNIWNGCPNGLVPQPNYCPSDSVTREKMAAIIIRGIGEYNPPTPPTQRFDDVPPSNTYYNFIDRMAALGITSGCSASPPLYCPSDSVTRGQMAVFFVRAFKL